MTDTKSYGAGNFTSCGYIVEWRLKPESAVIGCVNGNTDVKAEWRQAPYTAIKMVLGPDASAMVRPIIQGPFAERLAEYDVVERDVGEAIIACLKTGIKRSMRQHIEWRLVRVTLHLSHRIEAAPQQEESNGDKFQEMADEMLGGGND